MRCNEQKWECETFDMSQMSKKELNRERRHYKQLLKHAINDRIDVEMDDRCLRGFGTEKERKFYRMKWEEAYNAVVALGCFEGYPEWWETTGFTKEEMDYSWVLQDKK